ncbi:hypothetical protein F8M41_017926 [Gigaspora margarita]|uniref:Uncharacterized protein n=1 Tax=Gigaspora margarita TaxID=4874 RepID=A0A8H4B2X3_GIGMA|nr:hypothetical protein F8M41_017926 [Gigaspora margarita]
MAKAIKKNSSKPKSSRRKTKSKSRTKKKKSSKHVNGHIISDKSFSDSSDSENSTTSSENELETNTLAHSWNESASDSSGTRSKKRKSARPKTSSKKSSNAPSDKKSSKDARPLKIPTDNISLNAFFAILRSMVDSFTHTQPKEVSINGYNMINTELIALKDPVLNHFTSNFSDKEHEKFWHEITMLAIRKNVQVPSAMIDSGANCLVISKGLIKLLGAEVDKNKKPSVKWRNNSLESSGISYNISVTVGQGENSCTISEDFPVMDDDKTWILLGTPWLDRARWEPIVKHEFKLMHKNKVITISLSVHKSPSFLINLKKENLVNISILSEPAHDLLQEGGSENKDISFQEQKVDHNISFFEPARKTLEKKNL